MSAILSADDLNDFISPGVACIKPVETLPKQRPEASNTYEVAKEGQLPEENSAAQISLTDCLACSGCVTSAEAVLVSLQSHSEVLNALDTEGKIFVASVSPQVRASIATTYNVPEREAGYMIEQLLSGPQGLASGGQHGHSFTWVVDTNAMREASLVLGAEEALVSQDQPPSTLRPILSSACPGWICFAEKSQPHVLPHLSGLKSPQALTGTLLKTLLSTRLSIPTSQIWHVAIMPCFDKKLEASREELTDTSWRSTPSTTSPPVRDVDCVITAREVLMLADTRGISFPSLPRTPVSCGSFPDPKAHSFLFPKRHRTQSPDSGTSGGYLNHILLTTLSRHPSAILIKSPGRNPDVVEYTISQPSSPTPLFKAARYYGFRNIQNLVRKMKPPKQSKMPGAKARTVGRASGGGKGMQGWDYVEVMACPGGCTNGGGQVKSEDLGERVRKGVGGPKEWLGWVDEAYFSGQEDGEDVEMTDASDKGGDVVDGISHEYIVEFLRHWESVTEVPLDKLVRTSYRQVESNVGKVEGAESERVVELAGKIGGGW